METNGQQINICTCDRFAPDIRVLMSVAFNHELARHYVGVGCSSNALVDQVYMELLYHRKGTLRDLDDQPIDFNTEDENGDTLLDRVFRADPGRTMRRFLERASEPRRNRLSSPMIMPVLLLYYAKKNFACRTTGKCSKRAG